MRIDMGMAGYETEGDMMRRSPRPRSRARIRRKRSVDMVEAAAWFAIGSMVTILFLMFAAIVWLMLDPANWWMW